MNTMWSTYVQRVGTLYQSRALRFSDMFREQYQRAFAIEGAGSILEIGCGPGALCGALRRWYSDARITGTDRDSGFIAFAKAHVPGVTFAEEEATALSYADESFDVTISNTVAEHVEPGAFFGEQHRVLKPGGVCLVLSVRPGINRVAPCVAEESEAEQAFWEKVGPRMNEKQATCQVCQYPMNEMELPQAMARAGFRDISTEYLTINLTPDDPCYPPEMARAMIEANRVNDLDALDVAAEVAADLTTPEELQEMRRLTNARFDGRLARYAAGDRQWDVNLTLLMVLRGVK